MYVERTPYLEEFPLPRDQHIKPKIAGVKPDVGVFRKNFATAGRRIEIERISSCRKPRNVSLLNIKGNVLGASTK